MNPKIRSLAEQADMDVIQTDTDDVFILDGMDIEKFVKFIVQDCIDRMKEKGCWSEDCAEIFEEFFGATE